MKRALIIHGLDNTSTEQWFPWLKAQLEARGLEVWLPDMPGFDHPVGSKWVSYLLKSSWDFNQSLIVGHSAGAVVAMQLAQSLPAPNHLRAAVLVSAFNYIPPESELAPQLKDLFDVPLDYPKIAANTDQLVFVHGDNDPWCPLSQAQEMAAKTGGDLQVVPRGQHFTTTIDPAYREFPRLMQIMEERHVL